jgi:hypothetical protein
LRRVIDDDHAIHARCCSIAHESARAVALVVARGPALGAAGFEYGGRLLCVDGDNGVLTIGPIGTATAGS